MAGDLMAKRDGFDLGLGVLQRRQSRQRGRGLAYVRGFRWLIGIFHVTACGE